MLIKSRKLLNSSAREDKNQKSKAREPERIKTNKKARLVEGFQAPIVYLNFNRPEIKKKAGTWHNSTLERIKCS